jgi:serine/threonine-protein kinase
MNQVKHPTTYEFSGFRLDAQRKILSSANGEAIALAPKARDLLIYLVERPGELLTKEQLLGAVWPHVVVEENSLNQVVSTLRRALGDTPGDHKFIVTEPGRGYRFVATVGRSMPDGAAQRSSAASTPAPRVKRLGRPHADWPPVYAGVIALLAAIALAVTAYVMLPFESVRVARQPSIAVLPFANETAVNENASFFANGLHSELITRLTKLSGLTVISTASVGEYRDGRRDLSEIAGALDVSTILEGIVQQSGDSIRIDVRLVDPNTQTNLWAESYSGAFTTENAFAIQREIAISIADKLHAALSPEELRQLNEIPTTSPRAYNLYLSAVDTMFRIPSSSSEAALAVELLEAALEEDPQYALAAADLALAHIRLYWLGSDPSAERREKARLAAERALALAPGLPEAHRALGYYHYWGFWDLEESLDEFAAAARGLPGDPVTILGRVAVYRELGHWDEAEAELDRLRELDPRNLLVLNLRVEFYLAIREYTKAERALDRVIEIAPDGFLSYERRAMIPLFKSGDVTALERLAESPPPGAGVGERQRLRWLLASFERDFETQLEMLGNDLVDLSGPSQPVLGSNLIDLEGPGQPGLTYAMLYAATGQHELAARSYAAVRAQVEPLVTGATAPSAVRLALAESLAGLGEREEAIRHVRAALDSRSSRGLLASQATRLRAIYVLAAAGALDEAFEELDAYLSGPGAMSVQGLTMMPRLAWLSGDPRFEQLLKANPAPSGSIE